MEKQTELSLDNLPTIERIPTHSSLEYFEVLQHIRSRGGRIEQIIQGQPWGHTGCLWIIQARFYPNHTPHPTQPPALLPEPPLHDQGSEQDNAAPENKNLTTGRETTKELKSTEKP